MLNPNSKANTMISQSFIASEFQGYTDPFVNASNPTSSLNQFVRSKQTSDSGFLHEGQNQAFGFNNITTNHQPAQLENYSRKANQTVINANNTSQNPSRVQSNNSNQGFTQNNQSQFSKVQAQQSAFNQRYISPGIVKADSPTKVNQFAQQNKIQSMQKHPVYNQPQSGFNVQQVQQQKFAFQAQQRPSYQTNQRSSFQSNQSRPQSYNQTSQQSYNQSSQQSNNIKSSNQINLQGSMVGKRLKLNVSQQFSNSFTLNCVTEPQRSSILEMKKRQRQYRKSLQSFFV